MSRLKSLDLSLSVNVHDLKLRTILQYSKYNLPDLLRFFHGFILYEPVQEHIATRLQKGALTLLCCHRKFGKSTMAEDLAFQHMVEKDDRFVIFFCKSDKSAWKNCMSI